ncbi:hypothetical protein WBJ53_07470 [Spirosoma sp. SC4-14]|uniref:hypothetical protein n=1 Tax=Spirosoma sp. SC4-14 TaxID=3128900 RepID=UPI0030D44ADC
MKKLYVKLLFHSFLLLAITMGVVMVRYARRTHKIVPDLATLPSHFISNSVCFNAKLEHARQNDRLLSARTLIIGSSMGLNNVSAKILTQTFGEKAYNFSSWGFKPHETFQVLKQLEGKLALKHLIIPFNHTEFLADTKQIDYNGVYTHFFEKNVVSYFRNFFSNFSMDSFIKDWSFRSKYIYDDNVGFTLKFSDDGSVLLRPNNFIRPQEATGLAYYDTTGFARFSSSLDSISRYCNRNHIQLTMVYLPWRKDQLTPARNQQIAHVASVLATNYNNQFVNLSRLPVADKDFVDGGHMFEGGAIAVTSALIDTLTSRTNVVAFRHRQASGKLL